MTTKCFNKYLSEQLQNKGFAREYLIQSIYNDDLPILKALQELITKMGTDEYSNVSKFSRQKINKFLKINDINELDYLDLFLAPIGLKSKLILVTLSKANLNILRGEND